MKNTNTNWQWEKACKNTTKALELLIESSKLTQQYFINNPPPYQTNNTNNTNNYQYHKEYCTIKMSTARRTGHTTAIINTSLKYFNKTLILAPTLDIATNIKSTFLNINIPNTNINIGKKYALNSHSLKPSQTDIIEINDKQFHFGSLNTINNFRGYQLEAVYVDVACMMNNKQEKDIYDTLAPCMHNYPYKYFIFIE